jgi:sugar-specific transcriptional regulator TrmB/DNA-binding CsgD family transcriptional regulator
MLDVLGLDPIEEATYRRLVALPSATPTELAVALELETSAVTVALTHLTELGLVATSTTGKGQFVASPPVVGLGSLLREREDDLRRARGELDSLMEQYRGAAAERQVTDVVDVVTGTEAVAQRFGQLQRSATSEVLALVRSGVAAVSAEENLDEEVAVARGVTYRVVLERAVVEQEGFYANALAAAERGEEVRIAEALPLRMLVADRQLALIPMSSTTDTGSVGALLVHPSGLLDAMLSLFDFAWSVASPLIGEHTDAASRDGLDEVDVRVLDLLLAGLTDQAAGKQLGLSLRTVQRRVSHLMEVCAVGTRIQLGRQAERRGWVSR